MRANSQVGKLLSVVEHVVNHHIEAAGSLTELLGERGGLRGNFRIGSKKTSSGSHAPGSRPTQ